MKFIKNLLIAALLLLPSCEPAFAAFSPFETSAAVSATTSASGVTFTNAQSKAMPDVMVTNTGTVYAFVVCGVVAALPSGGVTYAEPILPGAVLYIHKGTATTCSAITPASTTTIYFTTGQMQ